VYLKTCSNEDSDSIAPGSVNSNGAVCDQKISKFFVSCVEESMARHLVIMEFIKS
jgi:hypothetical protein